MKLARFLTAGKTLVGIKDAEPRYRMGDPRSMPKFGSRKNPFGASAAGNAVEENAVTASAEKASAVEEVRKTDVCETQRRSETYGVLVKSASQRNTPREKITTTRKALLRLSGIGKIFGSLKSSGLRLGARLFANVKRIVAAIGRSLNPFRWKKSGAAKAPARPVQTELSLDKVRVVRNDLSDFDLDAVPGTERVRPQLEAKQRAIAAPVTVSAQREAELEPLGK